MVVVGATVVVVVVVEVVVVVGLCVVGRTVVAVVVGMDGRRVVLISSVQPTLAAKSHGGFAGLKANPAGQPPVLTLLFRQIIKYLHPNGCR